MGACLRGSTFRMYQDLPHEIVPRRNQRLPEQLIDEKRNLKFTFASMVKRAFVRNYWYKNVCHLFGHSHENQVIFM